VVADRRAAALRKANRRFQTRAAIPQVRAAIPSRVAASRATSAARW
jgi:hypothetical protein